MNLFEFEGLGTKWQVKIDDNLSNELVLKLRYKFKIEIDKFETLYSRFRDDSFLCRLNKDNDVSVKISSDLREMLEFGIILERIAKGEFSLNIAHLMSAYGYDSSYSFVKNKKDILEYKKGRFWLKDDVLYREEDVCIDLGAIGKGYMVDKLSSYLKRVGIEFFLINAGGDIFATTKKDESPWNVAIENPVDTDNAIGMLSLKNMALASSSPKKRSFGDGHHLINADSKKPAVELLGVSVVSSKTMIADGVSTAIFVTSRKNRDKLFEFENIEFLILDKNFGVQKSSGFDIKLFR